MTTSTFIPVVDHISLRVVPGALQVASEFMQEAFGWVIEDGRNPQWDSGESLFFHHPTGGVYVQLTVEEADMPGDTTDSFHLALAAPDTQVVLDSILRWSAQYGLGIEREDVGQGKLMIKIPGVFLGAFELVPYKPGVLQKAAGDPNWY